MGCYVKSILHVEQYEYVHQFAHIRYANHTLQAFVTKAVTYILFSKFKHMTTRITSPEWGGMGVAKAYTRNRL